MPLLTRIFTSTRRFSARPALVSLDAASPYSPIARCRKGPRPVRDGRSNRRSIQKLRAPLESAHTVGRGHEDQHLTPCSLGRYFSHLAHNATVKTISRIRVRAALSKHAPCWLVTPQECQAFGW